MVKKTLPILLIFFIWFLFAKPFFLNNKIPYPTDYQLNNSQLWNVYKQYWGPIKNPAISDIVSQIYPWKTLTINTLKEDQIPYWNPYSFSGTPHLANYQSASFSITNIFYFIFDFKNAWSISVIIQPLLAGIFMYFFARSLKLREESSLVSSVSFMFCGIITTWMNWTTISLAISFLPLALFGIEKYYNEKKARYLLIISLSFPLSFFSGHFQISFYFAFYVTAFLIFKLLETKDKRIFLETFLFSFLGILLAMPQVLPSLELYFKAFRSNIFQKISPVSLSHLPTIIAPDFYGNPVSRNNFLGPYAEKASFAGTIPFALAIYSLFLRNKKIYFFFFMMLASILFCLNTPILDIIVKLKIPVISTSSLSRILVLFSFSIAILAGFGLDNLIKDITERKYKKIIIWSTILIMIISLLWLFVLSKIIDYRLYSVALRNLIFPTLMILSLIFLSIISFFNKKIITFLIICIIFLTAFDMLRFSTKWQPFETKENMFVNTPIISALASLDKNYRFIGPFGAEGSVYFGLSSTDGYDPLYINRYGEFIGSLNDGKVTPSQRVGIQIPTHAKYFSKVIDFLGIRYVIIKPRDLKKPWSFPLSKYPKEKFNLIYKEKDFHVYENTDVYPRAYLVGDYVVLNSDQKIISKILDENFDLRKSAVLEKDPKIKKENNLEGDVEILKYSSNKIILKTNSNKDAILILTDNFYPGWKSKVNEKQTEIIRTNYTFRGVPVPKGENTVEFYIDSKSFNLGLLLAVISFISITILIAGKWYTSKVWTRKKTATSAIKSSAKTAVGKQTPTKQKK